MSYKPDESTLLDYLYGELDPMERQQVAMYLAANPEVKRKLDELDQTRKLLGSLKDKSVVPSVLLAPAPTTGPSRQPWFSGFVKNAAAVTLLLGFLMGMGKLTGADVQLGASGFSLAFSEKPTPTLLDRGRPEVDRDELMALIQTTLDSEEKARIQEQQQWQQVMAEKMIPPQKTVENRLIEQITRKLEDRMDAYFASVQYENANVLATYWEEVALAQKNYMNLLLEDYANGLQRVREEDLLYLQDRLNGLQIKNNQLEQEVSEILLYLLAEIQSTNPSNP
jgi:hypothetical protein